MAKAHILFGIRIWGFHTLLVLSLNSCSTSHVETKAGDMQLVNPDTIYCESFDLLGLKAINQLPKPSKRHCVEVVYDRAILNSIIDGCWQFGGAPMHFKQIGKGLLQSEEVSLFWPPSCIYRVYHKDSIFEFVLHLEPIGRKAKAHKSDYYFGKYEFDSLQFTPYLESVTLIMAEQCISLNYERNSVPFKKYYFSLPSTMLSLPWVNFSHATYEDIGPRQYRKTIITRFSGNPISNSQRIECVELFNTRIGNVYITPWWGSDERMIDCHEKDPDK